MFSSITTIDITSWGYPGITGKFPADFRRIIHWLTRNYYFIGLPKIVLFISVSISFQLRRSVDGSIVRHLVPLFCLTSGTYQLDSPFGMLFSRLRFTYTFMIRMTWILLAVGAMTNGFCQSTPPVEYKDFAGNRYQIKYPTSWQIDISRKMGADLLLFSPLEDGSDTFRDNVNVIIQDLTGRNMDLAKYKVFTDDQLKRISRSIEIYESVLDDTGDKQFYFVSYAMTQGQYRMRIMTKCFIANNKAYLATFTCELNKFEQYSTVASDILKSFKLND